MTTEILTLPDVDQSIVTTQVADIDEGEKDDNLRHIIRPGDNPHIWRPGQGQTGQDTVDIARVRSIEIKALCGKVFVPKNNPEGRDTCDTCIGIAGMITGEG